MLSLAKILCIVAIVLSIPNKSKSQYKEYDAQSLIRGGSFITSSNSLYNVLNNSPSLLYDKKKPIYEIESTIRVSEDLYNLYKMDKNIPDGDYQKTLSPLFKTSNNAYAQMSASMSYKKIGFSYLGKINGEAALNNPVYPEAKSIVTINEGFIFGYGNRFNKFIYGFSYSNLTNKESISSTNVLKYQDGTINSDSKTDIKIYNFSLGFMEEKLKTIFNFKKDLTDRYFLGASYLNRKFVYYFELHDMQNNNFENMVHYGLDFSYKFFKLSCGMNQNFPTFGLGLNFKFIDFTFGYGKINLFEQYRKSYDNYIFGFLIKI